MTQQIHLTWADMRTLARETAERLRRNYTGQTSLYAYAIPRGGLPAALLVQGALTGSGLVLDLCETPEDADIFIDDIIDSGATRAKFSHGHKRPFIALVDKLGMDAKWAGKWVVFPWHSYFEGLDNGRTLEGCAKVQRTLPSFESGKG